MGRMLSALKVLDRRPAEPAGDTGVAAGIPATAAPEVPARIALTIEVDSPQERIEAGLSKASSLAFELLADEVLVEASTAIHPLARSTMEVAAPAADLGDSPKNQLPRASVRPGRSAVPVWELPPIEPTRDYRALAARIAGETDSAPGCWPLMITAVRSAALERFDLMELAIALGEIGSEVLVVDSQHSVPPAFGQAAESPSYGLSHIMAGSATWIDAICPTNRPGISLVGAGNPAPHDCLWKGRIDDLWRELPTPWRHVLVGGGAPDQSLTLALAAICRSTYLIVELGQDRKQALRAALTTLRAAGAKLRGAIVLEARA